LDSTDFCNDTVRDQWPWVRLDFYGLSFDFERWSPCHWIFR